jgi:hypothetical protein
MIDTASEALVNQIAAQPTETGKRAIFVRSREPAIANDIRNQDRRDLPGSRHGASSYTIQDSAKNQPKTRAYRSRATEPNRASAQLLAEPALG